MKIMNGNLGVLAVLVAFLAVLGCYTVLSATNGVGLDTLSDAIKVLCGALAGVVISKAAGDH